MGKGLSELQKTILKLAYRNRRQGSGAGEVTNREVLIEYYGFKPFCNIEGKHNGAIVFNRSAIGIKRYNSASVAVVKAFNRLVIRGLADRKLSGIIFTDKGFRIARKLN